MSINRHSLIGLIGFFFLITFALINALFWFAMEYTRQQQESEQLRRFLLAGHILHRDRQGDLAHLMIRPSSLNPSTLLQDGAVLIELPFAKMIRYHGRTYFLHIPPPRPMFAPTERPAMMMPPPPRPDLEPPRVLENTQEQSRLYLWIVMGGIDLLILAFFAYLIRKLLPLYRLRNAIQSFKEGDTALDAPVSGRDEISQITREFNHVLEKIASMKEARTLFMRNVLHELKTPIMKGSLTADCFEEGADRERLKRIFERMGYLLDEFAKMERFSSGEWTLNVQEYRFVDLLDHACDILMYDKQGFIIQGEESRLIVKADFDLFAIALKNLLDNALRYGEGKPSLIISKQTIDICSVGEPLPQSKCDFSKPFNRTYESSSAGLGLGLHLSHSILQRHGFGLGYRHAGGINCFQIRL